MATPRRQFYVAHLCDLTVGHAASDDCWCEPVLYWVKGGNDNIPILVIEHNDETPDAHYLIEAGRNKSPDWVTVLLDMVPEREDE